MTTWRPNNIFDARSPQQLQTKAGLMEISTGTGGWTIKQVGGEVLYERMEVTDCCRWLNDHNAQLIPIR